MGIVRGDRSVIIPESDRVFTTILVSEDFQTAERCDAICLDVEAIWVEGDPCGSGEHSYGQFCHLGSAEQPTAGYWIFQQNECGNCGASGGDGPGGMPDTNNDNGNTGEYGSGGSGSTDNDDIATTPTISLEGQRRLNFLAELNEEERNCFQNNLSEAQTEAIYNFLENTDGPTELIGLFYAVEKIAFAKAIITAQCENSDAEVDDENRIIERFEGTKADCVHDNLKAIGQENSDSDLYNRLLDNFNDTTENWLYFEVGETGDDWGQTSGDASNSTNTTSPDVYKIVISNNLNQNGSNLAIMATLAHELVHAYMFDTLSDAGVILFDANTGEPGFEPNFSQQWCGDGTNYNGVDLNTLDTAERFKALICAMAESGTLNAQWTHDLFNENVFSVTTYQQQLADYIFENHDWNQETGLFAYTMQNEFGSNWKEKAAEYASWRGLEETTEFDNWLSNNSIDTGYFNGIITIIKDSANQNCN